jgi:hypothetical protein
VGMIKQLLADYCEIVHIGNEKAQDQLFRQIMDKEVEVSLDEMRRVVNEFHKKREHQMSYAEAEELRDQAIAERDALNRKRKREKCLEDLLDRLVNYKFASAIQYLEDSGLEEHDQKLVKWLGNQFGNTSCIRGDFSTLVSAALRSLPGYVDCLKATERSIAEFAEKCRLSESY